MSETRRVAKRAQFTEMRPGVSWAIGGDLWVFPGGGPLAVGAQTDLDGDPQTVSAPLAAEMIRAGKAEAVSVVGLDRADVDAAPGRPRWHNGLDVLLGMAEHDLELVRADAEEAA